MLEGSRKKKQGRGPGPSRGSRPSLGAAASESRADGFAGQVNKGEIAAG